MGTLPVRPLPPCPRDSGGSASWTLAEDKPQLAGLGMACFCFRTIFLIVLFSQYLKNVAVPMPIYRGQKKCRVSKFYLFQVFPVRSTPHPLLFLVDPPGAWGASPHTPRRSPKQMLLLVWWLLPPDLHSSSVEGGPPTVRGSAPWLLVRCGPLIPQSCSPRSREPCPRPLLWAPVRDSLLTFLGLCSQQGSRPTPQN